MVLFVRGYVLFECIRFDGFRRSSSDPASPGHLPPRGKGFDGYLHVSNRGTAGENQHGRRGRAPALRTVYVLFV